MKEIVGIEWEIYKTLKKNGIRLPDWIESKDGKDYRPETLTPEQSKEYADLLMLYTQIRQADHLQTIKNWVTCLGVLTIIGIVLILIF